VSDGESSQGTRVLIVDDDPLVLAVTRRVLTRAGYHVAIFEDPRRALLDVAQAPPFAVIADLHMPDIDGAELLARVAQLAPATRRILYTGEGQASELERALAPGLAHAIVPKAAGAPLLPETLARLRSESA
jgi:CheY-like chemotaxis protein